MHLLSHFGSAFCAGVAISALLGHRRGGSLFAVPLLLGAGAVLSDVDAVSVLFDHETYYAQAWYSHRGITHSPLGVLPIAALAALLTGRRGKGHGGPLPPAGGVRFACLFAGALLHILEDLPTPPGPWSGLMLLFPFSERRFGGWSHIDWQNEFLMVLLSFGALGSAGLLFLLARRTGLRSSRRLAGMLAGADALILGSALAFVVTSRYESPGQWERYQKRLMGPILYEAARSLNKVVQPIWSRELL